MNAFEDSIERCVDQRAEMNRRIKNLDAKRTKLLRKIMTLIFRQRTSLEIAGGLAFEMLQKAERRRIASAVVVGNLLEHRLGLETLWRHVGVWLVNFGINVL